MPDVAAPEPSIFARQWRRFIHALTFYTRVPWPKGMAFDGQDLVKGNVYFPLVGWLVAAVACLTYWAACLVLSESIAVIISMVATIWLTGAFHEDGFADTCDGFGGGYGKQAIMTIMKDSRVGTYASVGLCLLLLLKHQALLSVPDILLSLWVAHSVSRLVPLVLMASLPYVREQSDSKIGQTQLGLPIVELMIAALLAAIPLYWLPAAVILAIIVLLLLTFFILRHWFKRVLGGITGDCLGASQQITEVLVYLVLGASLWNVI
ncbi:adenosylcobinamide-GDP ribazoletransferase [Motilimonas cestriensis]|uniref:Adenosylcobinamide-GDP ribazoletransferase n=1 Tax=Motilimonas cestriensis TaxID=2742685 RepID=A0ABS8WCZ3_9GAMM|nr:adenosylcobinamide-GDP ribazoletransferase [Motilimonas cestriensis]MCE2595626.1 adenosylcobinamide-GDP ribazoletransferase [Motilimonas cestriensis]